MLIKQDCYFDAVCSNRPLHIWLPDDYGNSDERYPVMYFFDGHNLEKGNASVNTCRSGQLGECFQNMRQKGI